MPHRPVVNFSDCDLQRNFVKANCGMPDLPAVGQLVPQMGVEVGFRRAEVAILSGRVQFLRDSSPGRSGSPQRELIGTNCLMRHAITSHADARGARFQGWLPRMNPDVTVFLATAPSPA